MPQCVDKKGLNFEMLWPLLHICVLNNFGHLRLKEKEFHAKVADGTITDEELEHIQSLDPSQCMHTYRSF